MKVGDFRKLFSEADDEDLVVIECERDSVKRISVMKPQAEAESVELVDEWK